MRRVAIVVAICLCSLGACGCKQEQRQTAGVQPQDEQQAKLEQLQSKLADALTKLEALEAERQAAELGVPTAGEILSDLSAVSALLTQARSHIEDEQATAATDVLRRASDVVSFVSSRLPRAQAVVCLARAAAVLSAPGDTGQGDGGTGWDTARLQAERARNLCASERSGRMSVQTEVDADLAGILDAIDEREAKQAQDDIAELLRTRLAPSEHELLLARLDWCISAAVDALTRNGLSAAHTWVGDAQRAVAEIESALGGAAPAQGEAKPTAKQPPPTASPEESATEAEPADAAAEPEQTRAASGEPTSEPDTESAAAPD